MSDYSALNFYLDGSIVEDPNPYYDYLRSTGPVLATDFGAIAVSGYQEAIEIYRDTVNFSACNTTSGPFAPFPVPLEGDDISEIIEMYRDRLPGAEDMVTMDPPAHSRERALLMRLITPKRLKENESFMWRLADQQFDTILGAGRCEFIREYSQPFAMLAVADLLGVPDDDHRLFREMFGLQEGPTPGQIGQIGQIGQTEYAASGTNRLDEWFIKYVEDRRREPRSDVITDLALAKYPDGSTPSVTAVVRIATFLFAAGQETSARLLGAAVKYLAEYPELQDQLRANRELIPNFIEETLRLESPVKADHRLAKRAVSCGGVDIPPGGVVMLLNGAANRDPRHFECPAEFRVDRTNVRHHIAFGHGVHTCPGAPLARAEGRVSIERLLDRTRDIRLSEEHHGPRESRRLEYEPTWMLRGLRELHIEFSPV